MCVIVYKKSSVHIARKTLRMMWDENPDGAGIAWIESNLAHCRKGFMRFNELWETVRKLQNRELVIHFRMATHGLVNTGQTHPFPITNDIGKMKSKHFCATAALFHNGVLSEFGTSSWGGAPVAAVLEPKVSDTMDFIARVLCHIPDVTTRIDLLAETGSKYVLMQDGFVYLVGHWAEFLGLQVSNKYFAIQPTRKITGYGVSTVIEQKNLDEMTDDELEEALRKEAAEYNDDNEGFGWDWEYEKAGAKTKGWTKGGTTND